MLSLASMATIGSVAANFVVEGVVEDSSAEGQTIYIEHFDDHSRVAETTVKDGKFIFKGTVDKPLLCRIDVGRSYAVLVVEEGVITVDVNKTNMATGTKSNEQLSEIFEEHNMAFARMGEDYQRYSDSIPDKEKFLKAWELRYQEFKEWVNDRAEALYDENPNDVVGEALLYTVFMQESDLDTQERIISRFSPELKSLESVKSHVHRIERQRATAEGQPFADIVGVAPDNKPLLLSDFAGRGNYVLVDMWASWCGPCREEIPNLKLLNEKYGDKGLKIVGVFTWDEPERLARVVEEEQVVWPQIVDAENKAMEIYGTDGIPFIFLLNPDGTILKRNLRGDGLLETVKQLFE